MFQPKTVTSRYKINFYINKALEQIITTEEIINQMSNLEAIKGECLYNISVCSFILKQFDEVIPYTDQVNKFYDLNLVITPK
jgi:hypothetical protein